MIITYATIVRAGDFAGETCVKVIFIVGIILLFTRFFFGDLVWSILVIEVFSSHLRNS